jgi:dTDP-glucose pyrophosphorylase
MKRSVIIPAAGLATRMKPLSRGVSKAMIPVNGRPLISYVIEKIFEEPGEIEIVIVENELGDISEFVSRVYPTKNIKCVVQSEKKGPLHAIDVGYTALEYKDSRVTIWLGDTICLDSFNYHGDFLAVHPVADPHRWCIVDPDGNLYDKMDCEVPSNFALIGVYNFSNRKSFDKSLKKGMSARVHKGEHQISALLEAYMKLQGPMTLVQAEEWYDCGELNTYYESKARLLSRTARTFNQIEVDTFLGTVTKKSENVEKIEAERNWFLSLNEKQSLFCPRILDGPAGQLRMTLEPGTALNEVLVYDNLRTDIWHAVIRKILRIHHEVFFEEASPEKISEDKIAEHCFQQYFLKTRKRIAEVSKYVDVSFEVSQFLINTGLQLCESPKWSSVIHGDSHLGNIIYEPQSGSIKFVDPRGAFGNTWNQGDMRYDMAKLLQDFYCGYALIVAGQYHWIGRKLIIDWPPGTQSLSEFLEDELKRFGYDTDILKRLSILLLITAIPFHTDNPQRQQAMYSRGEALIKELQ